PRRFPPIWARAFSRFGRRCKPMSPNAMEACGQAVLPGLYRHFKGNLYRVLLCAQHSETGEMMVVYQALREGGGTWVRPARMWHELVTQDGQVQARFTRIGD
ncbi:MAG: DUF1653 domain-containing protein, partial [Clostridia bacterium]